MAFLRSMISKVYTSDLAFGWDPTEPVATRPLWMQRPAGSYSFFYFHDGRDYDTQFEVFD